MIVEAALKGGGLTIDQREMPERINCKASPLYLSSFFADFKHPNITVFGIMMTNRHI
jgi:hypothetical protein